MTDNTIKIKLDVNKQDNCDTIQSRLNTCYSLISNVKIPTLEINAHIELFENIQEEYIRCYGQKKLNRAIALHAIVNNYSKK